MKIVKPYAKIIKDQLATLPEALGVVNKALSKIEWCSRISHRSEDKVTEDSWKRIIQSVVMDHGDWSVVEHVSVSVDFLVDRGITHEIVRHRLFSYTQESTRFVNYEKKMPPSFIYPKPDVECELCLGGNEVQLNSNVGKDQYEHFMESVNAKYWLKCAYSQAWIKSIVTAESVYKALVTSVDKYGYGWRPQEARSVFPNALASRLIMTGNLRSWRHFFVMRTTAEAHPQMRQVTIPLLKEFQDTFPLLYDDIKPNMKQSESMKSAR